MVEVLHFRTESPCFNSHFAHDLELLHHILPWYLRSCTNFPPPRLCTPGRACVERFVDLHVALPPPPPPSRPVFFFCRILGPGHLRGPGISLGRSFYLGEASIEPPFSQRAVSTPPRPGVEAPPPPPPPPHTHTHTHKHAHKTRTPRSLPQGRNVTNTNPFPVVQHVVEFLADAMMAAESDFFVGSCGSNVDWFVAQLMSVRRGFRVNASYALTDQALCRYWADEWPRDKAFFKGK